MPLLPPLPHMRVPEPAGLSCAASLPEWAALPPMLQELLSQARVLQIRRGGGAGCPAGGGQEQADADMRMLEEVRWEGSLSWMGGDV